MVKNWSNDSHWSFIENANFKDYIKAKVDWFSQRKLQVDWKIWIFWKIKSWQWLGKSWDQCSHTVLCEGTQYDEDIVSNEIFIGQLLALAFLYVISDLLM